MKYRNWSAEDEDLPKEQPLEIFRLNEEGEQLLPSGQPDLVEPDFNRKQDMTAVRDNLKKIEAFLSQEDIRWWESFFLDPSRYIQVNSEPWYLTQLEPLGDESIRPVATVESGSGTSALTLKMQKERSIPEASIFSLIYNDIKCTRGSLVGPC